MARTKQTARMTTGGKAPRIQLSSVPCGLRSRFPVCYKLGYGKRHILKSRNGRHSQRPKSHSHDTASSKITANFKRPKDFPHFVKLPCEIQRRIWEMSAEEPRIVTVNAETNNGLCSSIPPILHVCSESRAVGLKHYTLAFESQRFIYESLATREQLINLLPPRVYFNFEHDMLYFRENWNKNVEGAWCCLSQLTHLVNEGDLKKVRRVGLDVNTRVCSLKTSGRNCHPANFDFWDGLEIMYLGYEDVRLGSDCPISSSKLESKDYEGFMQRYRMNPCWRNMQRWPQDIDAIEYLRNEGPVMYHGGGRKPDWLLKKFELVSIKHL